MAVLAATGWPDLQISATNCNFAIIPRNQFISGRAKLFSAKAAQWPFYQREAEATGWPDIQISATNYIFAIIPHDQFIRPNGRFINARPNGRFIKAEATGWPDLQIFSDQLHFRYYPAQSVYQRPGQAILSKSRPNCRFIKAEATMARPPDFSDKLHFRYYPARSIYQRPGQAILSKSKLNSRFMNARPNGRFMKAETTGCPDLQTSTTNCILHDQFISGRAKLFSAKAGPMAVLSTRGPMAVLSRAATG